MALRVEGDQLRVVGRSAGDQHGVTALGGLLLLLLLLLELLLLLVVLLERRRRRRQLLLLLELLLLVLTRRVAERLGESVCVHRRSTGRERLVQPLDRVTRGSPDVKKAANGGRKDKPGHRDRLFDFASRRRNNTRQRSRADPLNGSLYQTLLARKGML